MLIFLWIVGIYLAVGFVLTIITALLKDMILLHPVFFIISVIAWVYLIPVVWFDSGTGRWI